MRINPVATAPGSDRVISETLNYAGHNSSLIRESERLRMRIDPVATAPGSDLVQPHSNLIVASKLELVAASPLLIAGAWGSDLPRN